VHRASAISSDRPSSDPDAPKCRRGPSRRAMPNVRPGLLPSAQIATAGGANGIPSLGHAAPKRRRGPTRRPIATARPALVATIHIATPAQSLRD
jgi:hypothetical protein